MALRFANSLFEPLGNGAHVDHVQITVAESLGVEGRGSWLSCVDCMIERGAASRSPCYHPNRAPLITDGRQGSMYGRPPPRQHAYAHAVSKKIQPSVNQFTLHPQFSE
jgi:hypothetical protein